MTAKLVHVLGIHPTSRGFGWIVFDGPDLAVDWAAVEVSGDKNARSLLRIDAVLDQYRPRVLTFESLETKGVQRAPRVRRLLKAIVKRAVRHGIQIQPYSRAQIRQTFAASGVHTREQIAAAVADQIEALRARWPGPRKVWLGEQHNLGLFCAAACVLTYYARAHE